MSIAMPTALDWLLALMILAGLGHVIWCAFTRNTKPYTEDE